jgi:hypothetical protein
MGMFNSGPDDRLYAALRLVVIDGEGAVNRTKFLAKFTRADLARWIEEGWLYDNRKDVGSTGPGSQLAWDTFS